MTVVHKATASAAGSDPLVFVMSDATVDRYGDVIEPEAWKLASFKRNPIALFGHDSSFVIGTWQDVKVEGGKLLGRLELLRQGISERLDEIRAAVEAGVLRAVSVGFRPTAAEPIGGPGGGQRYTGAELLECSLVSIPANPNALAIAKQLHLSDDATRLIFGKSADEIVPIVRREATGEPALNRTPSRITKMTTLSQRIETAQTEIVQLRDDLSAAIDNGGDIDAIAGQIEQKDAALTALRRAEKALGAGGDAPQNQNPVPPRPEPRPSEQRGFDMRRLPAAPAEKVAPADYVLRAATIKVLAHVHKEAPDVIRQRVYGDDAATKLIFDHVTKAATAPATTTTSGWAAQLVQTVNADFMDSLIPASVYPELSARGLRLTFGRNGIISIPTRSATPTIAGSFVAEGAPIPVRQGAFTSQQLTPKKMAVISTFTREIAQHSVPAIEGLIRNAIQEDTSVAVDSVLLDNVAASTIRPAGLLNGVTVTTATAGGGINALTTDAKKLVTALITATNGNVRAPVWIMNPAQALSVALTGNAGGDFVFADAMNSGNFLGYPVIQSPTVTAGRLILVDAADFVSVTGDEPLFDISDQATLHMEDTAPLAIGTAGSPPTVAAPVRSLFQTDSIGIRMILPMNWALRRTGVLAWTENVTW